MSTNTTFDFSFVPRRLLRDLIPKPAKAEGGGGGNTSDIVT
jgi:hypothetical protein